MAARLHVERNADRDIRCRFILVRVDGRQIASMNYGHVLDIDLAPGHHEIEFDNTWARRKVVLEVSEGEVYAAQVGNVTGWLATLLMSILAAFSTGLFLNLIRVDPILPPENGERYLS